MTYSGPTDRDVCELADGVFQREASACSDVEIDCGLEPFVDAPPRLSRHTA